jgi:tetratricopeptide (TPR) repeat protein
MTEPESLFQQALNQGHTAAWDQDWQNAVDRYRQALDLSPEDPIALVSLGLAYFELGSYQESLECYSRALEYSPEDPLPFEKTSQLYELLGQNSESIAPSLRASELYLGDGNIPKSIECLARVTRLDAENLPAHSRLALIYERTGRIQQAVTEFLIVASLMQHAGDEDGAHKAAEHAQTLLPDCNEAAQAFSLIENGEQLPLPISLGVDAGQVQPTAGIEDALEGVSKVEKPELDPIAEAKQTALVTLANLVFERDDLRPGTSIGERVTESDTAVGGAISADRLSNGDLKTMYMYLQNAVEFHGNRLEDQAADALERAVELGLNHPAAYFYLGLIRSRGDRLESSIRYLQRSLGDGEYAFAARLILGKTLRFMGRLNESATNYLEALRLADGQTVPEDQAVDMMKMYDPIIEAEAKQTDPGVKNKLCDIVDELLFRPNWQQNLEQVKADYQINVDGAPAMPVGEILSNAEGNKIVESVMKINQYARLGYLRSAMEEAYFAVQFAPTYLPLHTYMGELLIKQERLPEAMDKFGAIAQTYRARGESLHAIQILQRIINAAPMDLEARKQLISLNEERGQFSEAIQEKIKLASVYYNLADLSRSRSVYFEAYQLNQNTTSNKGLSVQILHHLADIELQSLDWKQAVQIYQEIRTIDSKNDQAFEKIIELNLRLAQEQQAINELDEYLASMEFSGKNDQAVQFLGKITKENPDKLNFRQKVVDYYLQQGYQDKAIEELDALGEIFLNAGENDQAMRVIEKIIELDPPNKVEYLDLIAKLHDDN